MNIHMSTNRLFRKTFLYTILICTYVSGSSKDADWTKENLKKKVKTIYEEVKVNKRINDPMKMQVYSYETVFDSVGNTIIYTLFMPHSHKDSVIVDYTNYDNYGNKISNSSKNASGELLDSNYIEYSYDSLNRIIRKSTIFSTSANKNIEKYTYNEANQLTEIICLIPDSILTSRSTFSINSEGYRVMTTSFPNHVGFREVIYANGLKGKIISDAYFLDTNQVNQKLPINESKYDSNGNLVWQKETLNKVTTVIKINYDSYDNIVKLEIENSKANGKKHVEEFRYRYDNSHNWIRKQIFSDGRFVETRKRKITYYK